MAFDAGIACGLRGMTGSALRCLKLFEIASFHCVCLCRNFHGCGGFDGNHRVLIDRMTFCAVHQARQIHMRTVSKLRQLRCVWRRHLHRLPLHRFARLRQMMTGNACGYWSGCNQFPPRRMFAWQPSRKFQRCFQYRVRVSIPSIGNGKANIVDEPTTIRL